MKAVVVPGVTDLNKGDQALVWESCRFLKDCGCFEEIKILENGDTDEEVEALCGQSKYAGFSFCHNLLKHPRRGKHASEQHVEESPISTLRMMFNAGWDFLSLSFLLLVCNNRRLVKLLYSKEVEETVEYFRNCDLVAVKGGGFIHSYGERRAPYAIWFFLFYIRLANRLKKKVLILPNSFGPFEGLTVSWQVKKVLRKCGLIYARENVSSKALSNLLGRSVPVFPDLGFYLEEKKTDRVKRILDLYNIENSNDIVGITVRPWRFPGHCAPDALYQKYVYTFSEFAKQLVDRGYRVAFCNQSIGPNAHEDDRNAIFEIVSKLKPEVDAGRIIWINENLNCTELKAIYSHFYVFVGTRFHSIIFSITSNVPALAIGYGGNKANGIMSDLGVDDMVIAIEHVDLEKLTQAFSVIDMDKDAYINKMSGELKEVFVMRDVMIDEVLSYIST